MAERDDGARREGTSSGPSEDVTIGAPSSARPAPPSSISGKTLGHFEVLERIGAGGFGEVYRARDKRVDRMVALKILPEDFLESEESKRRFEREAKLLASLNHPGIAVLYSFEEIPGSSSSSASSAPRHVLVMELVEGRTLHAALAKGPLSTAETLTISIQIAEALAEAHRAGILHRDVKSANVMLTSRGQVKVLDFGLAKRLDAAAAPGAAAAELTREGTTLGTLSYMSPEQLLGRPVDARSDLFSFGIVLYEMLTGRLPFEGSTTVAVADAILHAEPRDFGDRPVPEGLKRIVRKLLEKDPGRRFTSAEEVLEALRAVKAAMAPSAAGRLSRRSHVLLAAAAIAVVALGAWGWQRAARIRRAREAIPEIARLVAEEDFTKAAALARQARLVLPQDPTLESLWKQVTIEVNIESDPPGAEAFFRPYHGDAAAWERLGTTPQRKARVPKGFYVWRVVKEGYEPSWRIAPTWTTLYGRDQSFHLRTAGSAPAGMVPVDGGKIELAIPGLDHLPAVSLEDYWIDAHEVTNEEYRKFVDAGGYDKPDFWKHAFIVAGRTLPRAEAMAAFRDATGRPGPATWELGTFPKGQEKHPVAGVSWYEAAAYAEFAGKSLPTIYHWNRAAQTQASQLVVHGSNFQGAGTVPVGGAGAVSGFGTTDMAGNVKEWCLNESSGGKRFILGGGFGEPTYMFIDQDAQAPMDRRANYGFRCVKLPAPPPAAAANRIEPPFRDFAREKPVSDEVFRAFKGLYAYDKSALNARIEETETNEDWIREKVGFDAAYGGERVIAYLYLPRNAAPPYQPVLFFPGSGAIHMDKFVLSVYADFIPKSGRALIAPVFKGTFERRDGFKSDYPEPTAYFRDHMIAWSKDVGRSLDYLETRKDVDVPKAAYLGLSWGGAVAPVVLAVEGRFRAAVLESGGLEFQRALPEADQINFVTRVKLPLLMLNGRYDHFFPVESSQIPLYRLLGTPEKDKKHVVYETGHAVPRKEFIKETLDWLDKYLGPVKR